MGRRFTRFGILFAMLLPLLVSMVGCASLSPAAKKIYMINNTHEVSACTRIGHVSAESMACIDPPTCMQAARNEGRNQAAGMGATHLVTTYSGINLTHGLYEGDAYSCANDKTGVQRVEIMTSSPTDAGCTKDIECKADRVCEGGRCVSPVTVQGPK